MRIWIDLANSPQVLFFRPLVFELERRGHTVIITSRDFAQTTQLADRYGMRHTSIGGHGGTKLSKIGLRVLERSWQLVRFARSQSFDLAVSHNSYAQALAASSLRIPFVTSMDYEHQPANHICFRIARNVIVPEYFPVDALRKFGARAKKVTYYYGLKEQLYLTDFVPQPDYLKAIGAPPERITVVMRPPGTWGLYNRPENPLFEQVFERVVGSPETWIIFLPRIRSQEDAVRSRGHANVWVPPTALDGPNLLYHADLAISGGGTMNREAAVLGTPTYSVFCGHLAAVDHYLIDQHRMTHVGEKKDVLAVEVARKRHQARLVGKQVVQEITDAILA